MVAEIGWLLISLGDDLQIGTDFAFGGRIELVFDDAQQSFVKFEQSVNLSLVASSCLL